MSKKVEISPAYTKFANFMIIKSPQKRLNTPINVSIQGNGGNTFPLERKDQVKYLGVLIDDKINWKHHISFVCSRVGRNSGILIKLRHYLTPLELRQIYFNLINPYISYAIVAWGCAYKSNLKKLQNYIFCYFIWKRHRKCFAIAEPPRHTDHRKHF